MSKLNASERIIPFVLAVIRDKERYLLTKRNEIDKEDPKTFFNKWQLPGGAINFGETAQNALLREVLEEIGLKVQIITILPYILNAMRSMWQGHGIIFLCKLPNKKHNIILNNESSSFSWYTSDEILHLDTLPGVKQAIKVAEKIY